ncbi:MAG: SMP-30/gluconolactonase/LRE family protein [Candidatus Latescibacteria bacterium]|nr:SMP-30/gluconolactonase/LRE family protein [Candidatus Latescibacterota bacterium]
MYRYIFLIILILACNLSTGLITAQEPLTIEPNIEPGKVYNLDTLPKTWFDFVFPSRAIWGKNTGICWFSYGPNTALPGDGPLEVDESLIYVIKGPITVTTNNGDKILHDTDCMLFKKGDTCNISTGPDSAEFLAIFWPLAPWIVSMKYFGTPPGVAIAPSTVPTLPPDSTMCLRKLDKVILEENILGRLVQCERGQLRNFTFLGDAVISSVTSDGEEFLFVMRGSLEKTIDGETVVMNAGDVVYIPEGKVHSTRAGQYGCEILALVTPAYGNYITKYKQNSVKIDAIVSQSKPDVVVDGATLDPIMSGNSEGPSWIHGKLYFSDQAAGVYVVNPDGSCKHILKDSRTCGTTALPDGNLAVCDLKNGRVIELSPEGEIVKTLADSKSGLFEGNPNDIIADAKGGVYVTINNMSGTLEKSNVIVYITPEGKVRKVTDYKDINFPNGIALNTDGSILFVSSSEKVLWMFDVQDDGSISNKRQFASFIPSDGQIGRANTNSLADGIEIDTEGNIYVATAMLGGIQVFSRAGEYISTIPVPSTNLVFGGEDRKTLYITSQGKVFSLKMKVAGIK